METGPTQRELADAPELALLAVLQHVLDLTTLTLVAIHPELLSDRSYLRPLDPQALAADQLMRLGMRLAKAVTSYRATAIASLTTVPDTTDIHF